MKEAVQPSTALGNTGIPTDIAVMDDVALEGINPRIVDAIRAIQAERSGEEPISWSDFSSHTQK